MKLFREYTFSWWEVSALKTAVFLIGAVVGAFFADTVLRYLVPIVFVAAMLSAYLVYVVWFFRPHQQ